MGDFLRLLQTTADEWPFIGGTPEKGELLMAYRVVYVKKQKVRRHRDAECRGPQHSDSTGQFLQSQHPSPSDRLGRVATAAGACGIVRSSVPCCSDAICPCKSGSSVIFGQSHFCGQTQKMARRISHISTVLVPSSKNLKLYAGWQKQLYWIEFHLQNMNSTQDK